MSNTTPNPGGSAPGLPSAAVLFLIWAFLFYLARIWSKVVKSDPWGSDGPIVSLAMLVSIAHVVSIYYAWHRGYSTGWLEHSSSSDISAIKKSLYAAQIFFVTSIGLTRTSTALFAARILSLGGHHRVLAFVMISVCAVSTPLLVLVIAIRGPFLQPWDTLDGSQAMFVRWVIVEVVGFVIDISTLIFSITIVWRLQMSVRKRMTVCLLFAVRLLILPVVARRLAALYPATPDSTPSYSSLASILTEAELQLFLILASATCLKPLFQPFHPGFFPATDTNLAVTGYTNRTRGKNSSRDPFYELSEGTNRSNNKDRKKPISRHATSDDASDEVDLVQSHHRRHTPVMTMRPDDGQTWTEAVAGSEPQMAATGNGSGIEATRTWTISYDKHNGSGMSG